MDMAVRKMELIMVQTAVLLLMVMVHGVEGLADATTEQVAYVGENGVLGCPLTELYTIAYPSWMDPDGTVYMWTGGIINPIYAARVSYYWDNISLVIKNITLSDAGSYSCLVDIHGIIREGVNTLHTRIRPQSSVISNRLPDGSMSQTEGHPLILTCTSRGGNPAPTVAWYRSSILSTALNSSNSGSLEGNGYTVTAIYTFSPTSWYDGSIYICLTSYTSPRLDVMNAVRATLRLNLKPSQPTVVQDGYVVAGSSVRVRCTTSGFRPEAITIKWKYNGGDYSQHATPTQTSGTDPYTATSTLQFTVQKVDNGGTAECIVAHWTMGTRRLTGTTTINVHYAPESATVTGNRVIVANGMNTLTLTCNVGVGNPTATTISWTRTSRTGTVYPVSTQNILVLTPTRDDDGDTVTCTANNSIGSVTSAPATLELHFHPITTVTVSPTGAVTEGPTDVTLQCSAHSKPEPTITWYHNVDTLQGGQQSTGPAHNTYVSTYKITSVSRQDYGEYKCIATNTVSPPSGDTSNTAVVTLVVWFPSLSATIEGNRVIEADGHNRLQLNCVVGESNPISTISWSKTGTVTIGNTHTTQDVTGSYGGYTRSQVLELTPTRDNDGDTITCTADNGVGPSITNSTSLNLKYNAIASIPRGAETVVEGAPSKDLTCNANSKPAANFKWYKGTSSTALTSGPGTGSGNQWTSTYTIDDVDRSHTGQYRCVADNGVGTADEKHMMLTLYYPPDVTATAQLNNGQLVATCSPSGVPDSYHYSNWVHLWSDGTRISQTPPLAATQTLPLTGLTYQDSGIYTCRAGNGVGLHGAMSANYIKQGSTSVIYIESLPIVLPIIIGPAEQKVPILLHEPTTVSITYYSNVADSIVSCHLVVNDITQPQSVGVVTTETSPIQLPVYGSVVSEQGTSATVTLTLHTEAELGSYVVKIANTVGVAVVHLLTVPEARPAMPIYPRVEDLYTTSVNISWELGYHGGPGQIFIIQYSTDGETWTDGATLDTGNSTSRDRHYVTVDSLSPGTLYSLRIHAYNNHGNSSNTDMITVTTSTIGADRRTSSSAVGPAVGGSAAALIVIALVVGLVVLHRKGYSIRKPCTKKSNKYRDHTCENEVEKNETRHEMSQARAASTTQDEGQAAALSYASLTTTRVTTSTMYDELNITGAGLVGDTTRDGSVAGPYETLEPRKGENASFYEELKPRDLPEIPTGQEVNNERERSGDEELEQLKREVAQAKDKKRRLKLEQEKERLRAELEKTNKEVAQIMNRDDRVIVYENLKIK